MAEQKHRHIAVDLKARPVIKESKGFQGMPVNAFYGQQLETPVIIA